MPSGGELPAMLSERLECLFFWKSGHAKAHCYRLAWLDQRGDPHVRLSILKNSCRCPFETNGLRLRRIKF